MIYQIKVQGNIDPSWSEWFSGMEIRGEIGKDQIPVTTLTGPVVDQACLRAIITRIWNLNLALISVMQIDDDLSRND